MCTSFQMCVWKRPKLKIWRSYGNEDVCIWVPPPASPPAEHTAASRATTCFPPRYIRLWLMYTSHSHIKVQLSILIHRNFINSITQQATWERGWDDRVVARAGSGVVMLHQSCDPQTALSRLFATCIQKSFFLCQLLPDEWELTGRSSTTLLP